MIYLFPTFPMRSTEFQIAKIPGLAEIYEAFLEKAKRVVPIDLNALHVPQENPGISLANTEQAHYACMLESLSIAEWAERHLGPCTQSSSYSMGLFSALVHAKAIELDSVLNLVRSICFHAHQIQNDKSWSTGAIIQFPEDTLERLIAEHAPDLEITDFFDAYTVLITGITSSVKKILDLALAEGALLTRLIPLSAPFHTSHLSSIEPTIADLIGQSQFSAPQWPILSSITQRQLLSADDIRAEICQNIFRPMNWRATMQTLASTAGQTTVECGASHTLSDTLRATAPTFWSSFDFKNFHTLQ
jgi:[acyl-carrier-protein] S-malonyltransferase